MTPKDIDFILLGCSKNLVDAERLMGALAAHGFACHVDPAEPSSPIVVINTCGFIGDAKEESINMILQMAERKKNDKSEKHPLKKIYVMGCLSQRYRDELAAEITEVDGWFGKFDYEGIVKELTIGDAPCTIRRKLTTPKHYAYLKISEGCNRMCSYCAIPLITGRHTSRPKDDIIDEARWMVQQGVKEINVIAQDLSSYGLDIEHRHMLPELIDEMAEIDGLKWIRLHYAYPTDFPDELLDVIQKHKNVCKYLDIALQHASDHMLSVMRRHITQAEQDSLIARIRERVPGICIRTTLLVGHPGETEEDFTELKEWVRSMRFDRMGAFAYSDEEGTYANLHYHDDIPESTKQQRVSELMAIQQDISRELLSKKIGMTLDVIIDRREGDYYIGRTEQDSPEVDCEVIVKSAYPLTIGEIYPILITNTEEFDLYGTAITLSN